MLYFIRHGQTDANLNGLNCGGEWDIELNDTGRQQARDFSLANAAALDSIDHVFISPMRRAQETAELVLGARRVSRSNDEGLREWKLGDASGKTNQDFPSFLDTLDTPPGGESFSDFQKRVLGALCEVAAHPCRIGLIVAHGGVWRAYAHYARHHHTHIDNCAFIDLPRDSLRILEAEEQ